MLCRDAPAQLKAKIGCWQNHFVGWPCSTNGMFLIVICSKEVASRRFPHAGVKVSHRGNLLQVHEPSALGFGLLIEWSWSGQQTDQ